MKDVYGTPQKIWTGLWTGNCRLHGKSPDEGHIWNSHQTAVINSLLLAISQTLPRTDFMLSFYETLCCVAFHYFQDLWIFGALTLHPSTNWPRNTSTSRPRNFLSTVTIYFCDTSTLWQFSTVTFWPKVDGLFVHPKKSMVCHSVTFQPTVILANPWLRHFVHFGFWFMLGFLPLKRLSHKVSGIWRDCSTRFSDPCRTIAHDV